MPELYHSISQNRLLSAVMFGNGNLPGESRFHFDAEGKTPGIWLGDDVDMVFDRRFGMEHKPLIPDKPEGATTPVPPVILKVDIPDDSKLLIHPLDPHQRFYIGDLSLGNIRGVMIPDFERETLAKVTELIKELMKKRGFEISVETFKPVSFKEKERQRVAAEKESLKIGKLPKDRGAEGEKNIY